MQPLIKVFSLQRLMIDQFQARIATLMRTSQRSNFLAFILERIPHIGRRSSPSSLPHSGS